MIMELPDQGGNPFGGMAQLVARLHGMQEGQGFESPYLHQIRS